jgi:NitT/TauT family transport system permease protein
LAKVLSLAALLGLWALIAWLVHSPLLPSPMSVGEAIVVDTRSGELPFQMACTLARVAAAFAIAFTLGVAGGYAMGRSKLIDRYADPWLVVLLNLPALVIIIFAYIWIGLNETAAIIAVALNKLPNVIVVTREGARSLDPNLDEMAQAFQFTWQSKLRNVVIPQLAPYLAAVSRSGLTIIWKIVLVVELLGRPNGVGFVLGSSFSLFDMTRILSYAISFVALMLAIETFLVQPLERRTNRWRRRAA